MVRICSQGCGAKISCTRQVSIDGIIESYCVPHFDSPSVFARIVDKSKGGHFSIRPTEHATPKQGYLPSSNVRHDNDC